MARPAPPDIGADVTDLVCRCGHAHSWHEHYRDGTDCSAKGCQCGNYSPGIRRRLARLFGRPMKVVRTETVGAETKLWYDCGCIHTMTSRLNVGGWYEFRYAQTPHSCAEHGKARPNPEETT